MQPEFDSLEEFNLGSRDPTKGHQEELCTICHLFRGKARKEMRRVKGLRGTVTPPAILMDSVLEVLLSD